MDIQSAGSVVLQALTQATSQDTAVLKPVEEQLRQWETQPGFCSVLLIKYSSWLEYRQPQHKSLIHFIHLLFLTCCTVPLREEQ
uniref:Uncharacterized protein n=1 Tax=Cyprinus carpio TaxID=7962 RepID=A0A8C2H5R6_CYPCA